MNQTPTETEVDDYPPISALNHLLYCERRCALLRVDGAWTENVHTLAGRLDHRRAHSTTDRTEPSGRTARGLRLVSHRLRLAGVADLVEFRQGLPGSSGVPFPVEYKQGRRRRWVNDDVQLCAQALCLEEMLGVAVGRGAIYHVKSRARREVAFSATLRAETEVAVTQLHAIIAAGRIPPAVLKPRCRGCSLRGVCLPEAFGNPARVERMVLDLFRADSSDPRSSS
ncbi:MAG: CRISPR-associated protein Cas4 [Isosphaeraceae bacterium]